MADWIAVPIAERSPSAEIWLDPFHVIKLSTDALDEIRRDVWNDARNAGQSGLARELKGARFAPWMNPERLTERHQQRLARVQAINKDLYRAYLIAQQLRMIYRVPCDQPGHSEGAPGDGRDAAAASGPGLVGGGMPR